MYKVTITYAGLTQDPQQAVMPICGEYVMDGSYIESEAYAGTAYDTKTHGMGSIPLPEPYATEGIPTPFPSAVGKFHLAVVGENNTVEFTVDDYKEAFFYKALGEKLVTSGFNVTVEEVED
jgi:hypothetical protein